jgi:LPXTG-site transpeptidase (sortase) family protein
MDTIGIEDFDKDVFLQIPTLEISEALTLVCEQEDEYDFSVLHEAPVWLCPDASLYLTDIGNYGASVILGHRQWGPKPKVFAELDKMYSGDEVMVQTSTVNLNFKVQDVIEVYPEDLWQEIAKYHVLGEENDRSFLILITCTPYGTAWERLLVVLERSYNE